MRHDKVAVRANRLSPTLLLVVPFLMMASGCAVVGAPIKATSKMVDWTTTSRSEADRKRGKEIRKREEQARRDAARCRRQGYPDC